jgi:hypothetical protein
MPVELSVADGPLPTAWLSDSVLAGTVMAGMGSGFTPVSPLAINNSYGFSITVDNLGNEAAEPLAKLRTGSFQPPAISTTSATSTVTTDTNWSVTEPLVLKDVGGNVLHQWPAPGGNRSAAWGWSTDGRWLLMAYRTLPAVEYTIDILACVPMGVGPTAIAPGARVFSHIVTVGSGNLTLASAGWGFAPQNSDVLCVVSTDSIGQRTMSFYDLRRNLASRQQPFPLLQQFLAPTLGAWRVSPGGDLLAAFGTSEVKIWEADGSAQGAGKELTFAVNGRMEFGRPAPGQTPTFTILTDKGGFGAIGLTNVIDSNNQPIRAIDARQALRCAVQVHVWVSYVSTTLTVQSATHLPGTARGDGHPPSAFIARIGPGSRDTAILNANWRPGLASTATNHWCAVAEAYTTDQTLPADPRRRTSTTDFQVIAQRQVAQRNLAVI